MKKKFLILTLCFTLIFTSINYKKSYADGGLISLPILATVSALAVGTGIVINNNDDLYDLGRMFYDYVDNHNDLTWDIVKTTFNSSIFVLNNGLVSTDSKFLDIVKGFFDSDIKGKESIGSISYSSGIPLIESYSSLSSLYSVSKSVFSTRSDFTVGSLDFKYISDFDSVRCKYDVYLNGSRIGSDLNIYLYGNEYNWIPRIYCSTYPNNTDFYSFNIVYSTPNGYVGGGSFTCRKSLVNSFDFPYKGGYSWDNLEDKKQNDSISLPIPGNLGQLVGQGSKDFWDNTDNLVGTGGITIPNVDNPSVSVDDNVVTFPNIEDVPSDTPINPPSDTPFSSITEYIIGLVVPSDSYWTDTFGGLYNNFTTSFPMVDMEGFKQLVTGEKKFPNIDINIMGVNGRVVNGDVVNSIVDWLRPIVAGFMMLCLMLFNYRKIYKTIRGVEPFQGIAQGTSDFRTGISEYNYMGTGLSKSDYEANQMELAKALHDYEQDTGKTYKIKI